MSKSVVLFSALLAAFAAAISDDGLPGPGLRKMEFQMPTRDGIGLHTLIYLPRDMDSGKKYTAIMDRSPYGYSGT